MDYIAAFMLGLLNAPHCVAMCGGIASALMLSSHAEDQQAALRSALEFGSGKLLTYTLLGAVAGLGGFSFTLTGTQALPVLRLATGLLLIALGLHTAGWWLGLARLEAVAFRLWQPALKHLRGVGSSHPLGRLSAGAAWGLLPCGIVYSMLGLAMSSGTVIQGSLIMFSFGLGTLPFVMSAGGLLKLSGAWLGNRTLKISGGILLMLFGVYTLGMSGMSG